MSCCGQMRSRASAAPPHAMTASTGIATIGPSVGQSRGDVPLRYRDRARILVRGPVTGRSYIFSGAQPTLVALRDADLMLATRSFARA
jgi:hypothetical protein